jgi:hypothetical protein
MVLPEQAPPCSQSTFVIGYDFSVVDVERYTGLFHGIIASVLMGRYAGILATLSIFEFLLLRIFVEYR